VDDKDAQTPFWRALLVSSLPVRLRRYPLDDPWCLIPQKKRFLIKEYN
jgi:hypothetical protein